jgi:hypothetical protein
VSEHLLSALSLQVRPRDDIVGLFYVYLYEIKLERVTNVCACGFSNEMPVVCVHFTGLRHTVEENLTCNMLRVISKPEDVSADLRKVFSNFKRNIAN